MSAARSSEVANLKRLLQVEKSLDKIRDRMMRMKKTEELSKVIRIVFEEVLTLGFGAMACDLVILDNKSGGAQFWISGELDQDGEIIRFKIPALRHKHYQESLDAWKSRKALRYKHAKGKSGRAYLEEMLDKMIDSNMPQKVKKFLRSLDSVHHTEAYMRHGFLRVASEGPLEKKEQQVLRKFSKVFEQTYTRFLDLQKAEEQTREAQIEAALERVRSRSMAMYESAELANVISTLFKQLQELGFEAEACGVCLYNEDNSQEAWAAGFGKDEIPSGSHLPFIDHPYYHAQLNAWKNQMEFQEFIYEGELKRSFDQMSFAVSDFFDIPEEAKDEFISKERLFFSDAFMKYGMLEVVSNDSISKKQIEILTRFAKVFEQTYTRFLDLQKAEEQAREAQIEAALERVRAASLAMHESKHLHKVVLSVFNQLSNLGVQSNSVLIHEYRNPIKDHFFWVASDADQKYTEMIHLPHSRNQLFERFDRAMRDSETFFSDVFTKQAKDKVWRHYFKHTDVSESRQKFLLDAKGVTRSVALFNNTAISMFRYDLVSFSESENQLLVRFGQVFDQAYTRFLDLKKAEEQARESQIEAALERVRARAMAMHSSDELEEVATVLREQMGFLGQPLLETIAIHIYENEGELFNSWFAIRVPGKKGNIRSETTQFSKNDTAIARKMVKLFESDQENYQITVQGKPLDEWHTMVFDRVPWIKKFWGRDIPKKQFWRFSDFSGGSLLLISREKPTDEAVELLRRSAKIFDLAYRRFLDLKKAEEQTREAQIEAALERVRAATMAMHNSSELKAVAAMMYEQMQPLELAKHGCEIILCDEESDKLQFWSTNAMQTLLPECYDVDRTSHPFFQKQWKAWKQKKDGLVITHDGEAKRKFDNFIFTKTDFKKFPAHVKKFIRSGKKDVFTHAVMKFGFLEAIDNAPLSEEKFQVLQRFAKVFEQTYTRFLDLRKAEEQAREAKVEAALERVRSRSMAMHESEEILDVIKVVSTQLVELGFDFDNVSFGMEDDDGFKFWMKGMVISEPFLLEMPSANHPLIKRIHNARKKGLDFFTDRLTPKSNKEWLEEVFGHNDVAPWSDELMDTLIKSPYTLSAAIQQSIMLTLGNYRDFEYSDNQNRILERLAAVFEQAYIRFLDLQKAEEQAREAQVEAALERVRSASMAMHESGQLAEVIEVVFKQIRELQIEIDACLIHIPEEGDDSWPIWVGTGANNYPEKVMLPKIDHPALTRMEEARRLGERSYTQRLNKELKNQLIQFTTQMGILEKERVPMILEGEAFSVMAALDEHASLALYNYKGTTYTENDVVIAQRMLGVFELAYTRFLDLQKAEAQTKEALKQSSLDRIRGEISSMRTTQDLERITPLVWKELTSLGVPFFRCGVFIIDDEAGKAFTYLSSPTGESLAVMALDIGSDVLSGGVVESWRKNRPHKESWDKKQFAEFTNSLIEQGHIQNPTKYQQGEVPPEKLVLQFQPFKQGMLYVGSEEELTQDQLSLVQALASAFQVAYARYEDFNQLEKAKENVEKTLGELRSTQGQLVHAEKMASLGELTAGIAHEIQNPLNFVNNFSEVNKELVEELKEAIAQNDQDEIKAIINDLLDNEDKVMHHGKRAEQIVKSMLQHSRGSEGKKEVTDINALCDEYMRLAYHGFRAKDQSFNADFKLDLDPNLPQIEVIPQDIGRVLLNIINNAFQAVSEKSVDGHPEALEGQSTENDVSFESLKMKSGTNTFKPTVELKTQKLTNSLTISIADNGPGIPDEIKEKIFQPFFTTKPTGQGTGLGLSLSYDIVTKGHEGTIEVESAKGKGTKFTISLTI